MDVQIKGEKEGATQGAKQMICPLIDKCQQRSLACKNLTHLEDTTEEELKVLAQICLKEKKKGLGLNK